MGYYAQSENLILNNLFSFFLICAILKPAITIFKGVRMSYFAYHASAPSSILGGSEQNITPTYFAQR